MDKDTGSLEENATIGKALFSYLCSSKVLDIIEKVEQYKNQTAAPTAITKELGASICEISSKMRLGSDLGVFSRKKIGTTVHYTLNQNFQTQVANIAAIIKSINEHG